MQDPSSEKHYIACGPEFGIEHLGKRALIVRATCGGKAAGRDFRNHLRSYVSFLNVKTCISGPDVRMRPNVKSYSAKHY